MDVVESSEASIHFYHTSDVVVLMADCRLYACMKSNVHTTKACGSVEICLILFLTLALLEG